jgi:hypothetical protein
MTARVDPYAVEPPDLWTLLYMGGCRTVPPPPEDAPQLVVLLRDYWDRVTMTDTLEELNEAMRLLEWHESRVWHLPGGLYSRIEGFLAARRRRSDGKIVVGGRDVSDAKRPAIVPLVSYISLEMLAALKARCLVGMCPAPLSFAVRRERLLPLQQQPRGCGEPSSV